MPRARRKVKEETSQWGQMGPAAWESKMKEKHMGLMPLMMWKMKGLGCGCFCHKSHGLGAFVFAVAAFWIMNTMGTIPAYVPWWLEFLAALGFAAMYN